MLKALLEGKPFGHPLHPALVHFPIGLFVLSLVLDGMTLLVEADNSLVRGAFYAMGVGVIMALVAAVPGLVDWADIRQDHPAKPRATTHMGLNITAVVLYLINLGVRYGRLEAESAPIFPFILSLAGIGILSYSGYLGGNLVYNDGIPGGRHRRHTDTPEKTIQVAARPGKFVAVANDNQLKEGATLRAEVGDHIMALVRINGEVYAFQEFCTHRFGPLSEGSFQGHEVMCPWHRSCFDVRNGKVTQGPATLNLKIYDVSIWDDQIYVRLPAEEKEERKQTPQRREIITSPVNQEKEYER